jgi:hypothetical protein
VRRRFIRVALREHYGSLSKQSITPGHDRSQHLGVSESHLVALVTIDAVSSTRLSLRPKKELSIDQWIQWTECVLCDVRCFVCTQNGSHDLVTGHMRSGCNRKRQSSPYNTLWRPRGGVYIQLYFFFNLGAKGDGRLMPRPGRFTAQQRDMVTIIHETGWVQGPVWSGAENFAPTGIRSPDRPVRSMVAVIRWYLVSKTFVIERTKTKCSMRTGKWRLYWLLKQTRNLFPTLYKFFLLDIDYIVDMLVSILLKEFHLQAATYSIAV